MNTLTTITNVPTALRLEITEDQLCVYLSDGRTVSVPISWYPRLSHASSKHLSNWKFIAGGSGIHWPELDEDISVQNLLFGQPSGENAQSFRNWKKWYQSKLKNSTGKK